MVVEKEHMVALSVAGGTAKATTTPTLLLPPVGCSALSLPAHSADLVAPPHEMPPSTKAQPKFREDRGERVRVGLTRQASRTPQVGRSRFRRSTAPNNDRQGGHRHAGYHLLQRICRLVTHSG